MTTPGVCTSADDCPIHPGIHGIHPPWGLNNPATLVDELNAINAALERAIPGSWDDDAAWSNIASQWITHMATTHGAHCPGRHCQATADTPAYVGTLREMLAAAWCYGDRATAEKVIRDLANELGVDLDG